MSFPSIFGSAAPGRAVLDCRNSKGNADCLCWGLWAGVEGVLGPPTRPAYF
jgi:hypothetical protein